MLDIIVMGYFLSKVLKLLRLLPEHEWRRGLLRGVAASVEHDPALANLELAHIVDIGANRGQFTLFCRVRFPEATVVAFEPLVNPALSYLNLFKGSPSVRLVQAAVGSSVGTATMHVSKRDDSSSLLPITSRQTEVFPGTDEVTTKDVNIGRLETYLSREEVRSPALLKIDVQGYEADVLDGCDGLLDCFDYVYVECSFVELYAGQALAPQIISWLQSRGFRLKGRFNETIRPGIGPVQADFLFVHA